MSGRIAKSQIPVRKQDSLPPDAKVAIIQTKNDLRGEETLRQFKNRKDQKAGSGPPLPAPSLGCEYYEVQVGKAHEGDEREAGSRRLVFEVNHSSGEIREIYYTENHYAKGAFWRVV